MLIEWVKQMAELFFIVVFGVFLLFSGLSLATFILAAIVSFVFVAIAGVLGTLIKFLPWILLALVGWYVYKHVIDKPNSY